MMPPKVSCRSRFNPLMAKAQISADHFALIKTFMRPKVMSFGVILTIPPCHLSRPKPIYNIWVSFGLTHLR